jgi:hypothetical protein
MALLLGLRRDLAVLLAAVLVVLVVVVVVEVEGRGPLRWARGRNCLEMRRRVLD